MYVYKYRKVLSMIWVFDEIETVSDHDYDQLCSILPDDRKEKAGKYIHSNDQKNCLIVYVLLVYGIYKEYGLRLHNKKVFKYGDHGKPYLREHPQIHFNFSHCKDAACCVLSRYPVGIDVESTTSDYSELIDYCCSEEEKMKLKKSDSKSEFFRLWTLKESYLKCIGLGITDGVCEWDFADCLNDSFTKYDKLFNFQGFNRYAIAACGEEENMTINKVHMNEIMSMFNSHAK